MPVLLDNPAIPLEVHSCNLYRLNEMDYEPGAGLLFGSLNNGLGGSGANFLVAVDIETEIVTLIGQKVDGLDAGKPFCCGGDDALHSDDEKAS